MYMHFDLLCLCYCAIFTARRNAGIASAVLAVAIPSVCPSVRLTHAGIVSKRRHVARSYADHNVLKMGIKYLNLSYFGQLRQYRAKSLLQSFII